MNKLIRTQSKTGMQVRSEHSAKGGAGGSLRREVGNQQENSRWGAAGAGRQGQVSRGRVQSWELSECWRGEELTSSGGFHEVLLCGGEITVFSVSE